MKRLKNFYDDHSGAFSTVILPKRLRGRTLDRYVMNCDDYRKRYYSKFPYTIKYSTSLMIKLFGNNFNNLSSSAMPDAILQKFRDEFAHKFKGPICHEVWHHKVRFKLIEDAILFKMMVS